MSAPRRNQAAWERHARDLSDDLSAAASLKTFGLAAVSDATGLSTVTINDCMYRPVATDEDNPRTYLCRPAYRVGSVPYWGADQVEQAARVAAGRRERVGRGPELPLIADGDDAPDGADVVGVRDIALAVERHEQTVRKWTAGSYSTGAIETPDDESTAEPFPEPVARRMQPTELRQGNPETVYRRAEVLAWLASEMGITAPRLASREAATELHAETIRVRVERAAKRAEGRRAVKARRAAATPAKASA